MVLLGRIELPTSALPRMRSTTELQQPTSARINRHATGAALLAVGGMFVKRGVEICAFSRQNSNVTDPNQPDQRKARLAAQLRANLHRRKAQAREMAQNADDPDSTLPKAPPTG
ncbi:MAG: hypothetical protein RLY97_2098 [Pseudomonadota bacterium]|jgi:hypothetical protein